MSRNREVGMIVRKNEREGGGTIAIIGHVQCERNSCQKMIELREVQEPSKEQTKRCSWYREYAWCPHCGMYQPNTSTRAGVELPK